MMCGLCYTVFLKAGEMESSFYFIARDIKVFVLTVFHETPRHLGAL